VKKLEQRLKKKKAVSSTGLYRSVPPGKVKALDGDNQEMVSCWRGSLYEPEIRKLADGYRVETGG